VPNYVDPASIDVSLLDANVYDAAGITLALSQSYRGLQCVYGNTPKKGVTTLVGEKDETKDYVTKVVNALNTSMSHHRSLSIHYSALVAATITKAESHSQFCQAYMEEKERHAATMESYRQQFEGIQLQMGPMQLENDALRTKYTSAYQTVLAWKERGEFIQQQAAQPVTGVV